MKKWLKNKKVRFTQGLRLISMKSLSGMKRVASVSRKLSYNVPSKAISRVGSFVCPSCHLEVPIKDLISKKGNIGCTNCLK